MKSYTYSNKFNQKYIQLENEYANIKVKQKKISLSKNRVENKL